MNFLNQHSYIDYALVSSTIVVGSTLSRSVISIFVIMDPAINFSLSGNLTNKKGVAPVQHYPRWDKGLVLPCLAL